MMKLCFVGARADRQNFLALLFWWMVVCGLFVSRSASAAPLIIDRFEYATTTAARAAWTSSGAPGVTMASSGEWGNDVVMTLPLDFATRETRCYWDRTVSLDLTPYTDFALEVFAPDPTAISWFTLYFRSGSGWYAASAYFGQGGWQTLKFSKSSFTTEGTPAGWNKIDGIRLSPWKSASRNTYLAARELRAYTPPILLIRDPASSNPNVVEDTIERHRSWLGGYNIDCGVLSSSNVASGLLAQGRLAILPYNENISTAEWTALESFVAGGGKLLVYYLLPSRMEPLLGVRRTGWSQGDYAAWKFSDPSIPGLPARVLQDSWNVTHAVPNGTLGSRISASWQDSAGVLTSRAAWIASSNGCFISHILLGDDAAQKAYALLCLVAHFAPEVWPQAAAGAVDNIGRVGPYLTYAQADAGIRHDAEGTLRAVPVADELSAAAAERARALAAMTVSNYSEAVLAAQSAQSHLKTAYAQSLRPVTPEFRAIWEHHATGPFPGNWNAAASVLASNGFNAVFPNMLWGGLAHYKSAYLPRSADYTNYGDQISACVTAAHARGIEVHVWKVNWNLSGAPQSFIDALRSANRTQVSSAGEPEDWLCPSHPDNLALETNSMLEVVRNYDVDGIHFDYIRYPDADHCYCSGCAARFQSQTGRVVPNWPADVLATGVLRTAFLNWRREQITRLVSAVYTGTKALKPQVKVSAAVFPDANSAFDGVGQDWRKWVAEGLLDFVCPMDYTAQLTHFTNLVNQQLGYVAGRVPTYPGIGAFIMEPDGTLAQIQATRAARTSGFIVFELSPTTVSNLFSAMRAGATAPDEPDLDGDLLPDAWETRWFGDLVKAARATDSDGDGQSDYVEYVAGSNPTWTNPGLRLNAKRAGSTVEISFVSTPVSGGGYQNAQRHYSLEQTTNSTVWQAVPGLENKVSGTVPETILHTISDPSEATYFRAKVWLQEANR